MKPRSGMYADRIRLETGRGQSQQPTSGAILGTIAGNTQSTPAGDAMPQAPKIFKRRSTTRWRPSICWEISCYSFLDL